MSGQTVTGLGLQFTDDNKYAYCSSGLITVDDTETNLLEFKTDSYYLVGSFQCILITGGDDFRYYIYFNDVRWSGTHINDKSQNYGQDLLITIPPFTTVKVTAANVTDTSGQNNMAVGNFKVGMAPRVGN